MSSLTTSNNSFRHGHIFSAEICRKLEAYTEHLADEDINDSPIRQTEKSVLRELIAHYNANVNPKIGHNRSNPTENAKARRLSYEMVDEFLKATHLTAKQFLELCMIENKGLTNFYDKDWVEFTWATPDMAKLCVWLDYLSSEERALVRDFIVDLLPASYYDFLDRLYQKSNDYGFNNELAPAWSLNYDASHKDFLRINNLSDRVAQTLWYVCGDKQDYPSVIAAKYSYEHFRWIEELNKKSLESVKEADGKEKTQSAEVAKKDVTYYRSGLSDITQNSDTSDQDNSTNEDPDKIKGLKKKEIEYKPEKTYYHYYYTVDLDFPRIAHPLHFWGLFNFSDIHLLCDIFRLSPHWVFYGEKDGTVLAKNPETEKIIDLYTFLPEAVKPTVLQYVISLGRSVRYGR